MPFGISISNIPAQEKSALGNYEVNCLFIAQLSAVPDNWVFLF
jgi:hypothetical protein